MREFLFFLSREKGKPHEQVIRALDGATGFSTPPYPKPRFFHPLKRVDANNWKLANKF